MLCFSIYIYEVCAKIGYSIIDFLGWSASPYDWIQDEVNQDKEEIELERREREEERREIAFVFADL